MYNQGSCGKPSEQRRAQISLWLAYVVDVATDLAGTYVAREEVVDAKFRSNVFAVSHDVEPPDASRREGWCLRTLWHWVDLYCGLPNE
jgi:hypothetical protein